MRAAVAVWWYWNGWIGLAVGLGLGLGIEIWLERCWLGDWGRSKLGRFYWLGLAWTGLDWTGCR